MHNIHRYVQQWIEYLDARKNEIPIFYWVSFDKAENLLPVQKSKITFVFCHRLHLLKAIKSRLACFLCIPSKARETLEEYLLLILCLHEKSLLVLKLYWQIFCFLWQLSTSNICIHVTYFGKSFQSLLLFEAYLFFY